MVARSWALGAGGGAGKAGLRCRDYRNWHLELLCAGRWCPGWQFNFARWDLFVILFSVGFAFLIGAIPVRALPIGGCNLVLVRN